MSSFITRSLDNTVVSAYSECERKAYYSYWLHRKHKGLQRAPLSYGTSFHKGKEAYFKSGGDMDLVAYAIHHSWEDHGNPEDHRTPERCVTAFHEWVERWGGSFEAEQQGWGRTLGYPEAPMIEIITELTWEGALHPYTVKIDRIFEHQGLIYVEDTKTSSQLGPQFFKQFSPSSQMMGYAWVAGLLTGLPIAGVRVDAHGILKTQNKFERQTIPYNPDLLYEAMNGNYNALVKRIDYSCSLLSEDGSLDETDPLLLEAFPHRFNACAGKYGQCKFADVCTMAPRLRQQVLDQDFIVEPWNPLEAEDEP